MPDTLEQQFRASESTLKALSAQLEQQVCSSLSDTKHVDRISFRVKDLPGFLRKAGKVVNGAAKYSLPFEEIEDFVAGRVIVFFTSDIPIVLQALDKLFRRIEGDHKAPARDAEFGYESYHRVYHVPAPLRVAPPGAFLPRTFEMQVRTIFMHAYAEPQHDIDYKGAEELPTDVRRELAWIAASAWGADQAYERVLEWTMSNASLKTGEGE